MDANIKLKLKPFTAPSYVIVDEPERKRQDGFKEARKYHVSELDEDALSDLCDQFRADIFKKARANPTH